MIGGINSASLFIASTYNQNNNKLSETLSRIASGKKINHPSDNFTDYVRASYMQNDIDDYQNIKENLTTAKSATKTAAEVGNSIYEDLVELKNLVTSYYNTSDSADDDTERAEILAEFNNLKSNLSNFISNTYFEGTLIHSATTLESIDLDPDGTGTLSITFSAADIVDPSAPSITGFVAGDAVTTAANLAADTTAIDAEITAATNYLVKAESYDKTINRQINISDTIIQSKQSAISLLTDIDEVSELSRQTELQVRQQASIAMLSQANMARESILRLYM